MDKSREELYALVWAEPMSVVAPKLGISDVALKKRCANLGVPTPPRGYWAKLEAGKKPKKTPLPTTWTVERKKKLPPQSAEEARKLDVPDRDYTVAKHPSHVAATKRALRSARPSYYGVLEGVAEGALRTRVALESVDRALWLWTELIPRLAEAGVTLMPGKSMVTDGIEMIEIELKEMTTKYESNSQASTLGRPPRIYPSLLDGKVQEWAPTGVLVFRAEQVYDAGCAQQWPETELRRMEDRLNDVAYGISTLLARKHEVELARAERQRQYEEERRREEARERERQHEKARRRKLSRLAESFAKAERVRDLIAGIESRQKPSASTEEFLSWARRCADQMDPVSQILNDLEQSKDPVEPSYEDRYPSDSRHV